MGAIPKTGQERLLAVHFCLLLKLVCFFLSLTTYNNNYPLMHINLSITWQNEVVVWQPPFLSWDVNSQSDLCLLSKRRKPKGPAWHSNPAFGGRGCGVTYKSCGKSRKVPKFKFDATLGYPGEGWSKLYANLKIATWNTRSMTYERFNYCKSLAYDVLAVTELWRVQENFQDNSKAFVVGEAKLGEDGEKRFEKDRAAGVGILLSKRAQKKVLSFGSTGERVCYVRLEGPVCNLFIVATYLPHRGRAAPDQDDTIQDLQEALQKAATSDCIIILGDFNEQLPANVENRTGKWVGGEPSKNAKKILDLMHLYDLFAVNTIFEPKRGETVHTYLCPKPKDSSQAQGDFGFHVGEQVTCRHKGKLIKGEVTAVNLGSGQDADVWTVVFEDGYTLKCGKRRLKHLLRNTTQTQGKKQIDHILVSNRWRSSVTGCKTRWGPSVHRSVTGKRSDHALLECTWKWRLKIVKSEPVPDYSVLQNGQGEDPTKPNKYAKKFGQAVQEKLQELEYNEGDGAEAIYDKLCSAITYAAESVLPKRRSKRGIKRKVSNGTKKLYDERVAKADCPNHDKKAHQKKIKEAGLQDFLGWVNQCAEALNDANGHGDTGEVFNLVNQMEGRPGKPPKNLTEDEDGNALNDAEAVAARWYGFLSNKFSATQAEEERPPMPPLPQAHEDVLSEEEALRAISKLSSGKACGPDAIPGEVYKSVPICKQVLVKLLQCIWAEEVVPEKFAKAVFVMLYKNKGSPNDPTKYRCIGLLGHAYKALSHCMQERITAETKDYLSD